MKRFALFLIVALALFSTVGSHNDANANATNSPNNTQVQDTMVLGKLYFVNFKEGERPIMTGLSLHGNVCGSEAFNNKPYAAEGIRSVFELDEWIEFHPQTNAVSGIKVMVFQHKADQAFYLENALNDETTGYIQECDLAKDPDEEESYHWGSFYLHPEEVDPGYYDFVFLYHDRVFATMLTHFYDKEELYGKSDSELEELMSQSLSTNR